MEGLRREAEDEAQGRATKEEQLRAEIDGFAATQERQPKNVGSGEAEPDVQAVADLSPIPTKGIVNVPASDVKAKKVGQSNGSGRVVRRTKRSYSKRESHSAPSLG